MKYFFLKKAKKKIKKKAEVVHPKLPSRLLAVRFWAISCYSIWGSRSVAMA